MFIFKSKIKYKVRYYKNLFNNKQGYLVIVIWNRKGIEQKKMIKQEKNYNNYQQLNLIQEFQNSMKYLFITIFFISLISMVLSDDLYYSKNQYCIQTTADNCKQWNTTVQIGYYQSVFHYMCFPSTTYVLSQNGPIPISDLKIGDNILGYDFQSSQNRFSTVNAWLHRDTQSTAEFTVISTKQGEEYIASGGHNIAYSSNGTISFKFADKFQEGDELVSIEQNKIVQGSDRKIYKKGLYSPVNSINNFYIFPSGQDMDNENKMILVHCFSQINRPHENEHWVHSLLKISDFLGLNSHENIENQQYMHPITHILNIFSIEHRKIRVLLSEGDLDTIQLTPHHYRASSSSATSNQQQRKNNILTIFSYLLMNNFLVKS